MNMIELSEKSITVLDKLELDENKILVVSVDVGTFPKEKAKQFMAAVGNAFEKQLNCHTIVVPSSIKLSVIDKQNEPE